ncbi:MAG: hypothetical protein H0T89_29330 [Deltaproteobacteria bacterium]|nr:hypothetical protein [Deltaproteobacteria bacterium]MDQ3297214.1 hypothetical protein [Myxococcota bacterium]
MPASSKRILVVDGDEVSRQAVGDSFRERGWETHFAHDVRSATDVAIKVQPHVILTELSVTGATEYHFLRPFRSAVEHDVVIIGATRVPQGEYDQAMAAGFDAIFEKPIDVAQIDQSIGVVLPGDTADERRATIKMQRLSRS